VSETELKIELLPWQQEVFNDPARFKVVAAGRRTGKTRLAAWTLILNALQTERGNVFYVAPTQGQARDIIWGMLLELGHSVIVSTHVNNLQIKLVNGSTISLKGSDRPETMRGVSLAYLVLDEWADMKPMVWEEILRPALADLKGTALFIGTPMGRNHFYDLYKMAELGDDPTYKAWHFTSYDNPLLDPAEIDHAKRTLSSYAFRQEFMASFEARGSELFKEDWVKFGPEPLVGDYYVAVDLAGFEEVGKRKRKNSRLDDTAIAIVKVNEDGWWIKDIINGRWDLNETASQIMKAVIQNEAKGVGIERGIAKQAVMSPLSDLMRRQQRFFRVDELTHGNKNKTDRVVWALQGRFENGYVSLNKDGDWQSKFMDQLFQFPDPLTHDDMIDALAYVDQMATVSYHYDLMDELDDFEFVDEHAGY
jgi:predicted phage terminase large subunit-like protein